MPSDMSLHDDLEMTLNSMLEDGIPRMVKEVEDLLKALKASPDNIPDDTKDYLTRIEGAKENLQVYLDSLDDLYLDLE